MRAITLRALRWWAANAGLVLVVCMLVQLALIFNSAASTVSAGQPVRFGFGPIWLVVPIAVTAVLSLGALVARGWRRSRRSTGIWIGLVFLFAIASNDLPLSRAWIVPVILVGLLVAVPAVVSRVLDRLGLAAQAVPLPSSAAVLTPSSARRRRRGWIVVGALFAAFAAWGTVSVLIAHNRMSAFCATVQAGGPVGDFGARAQAAGFRVFTYPARPGNGITHPPRIVAEGHAWLLAKAVCFVDHNDGRVVSATVHILD